MASTTGRGAGWISPSSGRRARSTGAQTARSQASAGLSSSRPAVRSSPRARPRSPPARPCCCPRCALARCRVRPSQRMWSGRTRARHTARADRLVRLAEAGQVDRDHAVGVGQRVDGGEEGGLGPAEAVQADDRLGAGAGGEDRDRAESARAHLVELQPPRLLGAVRRRQEAHAHVKAAANLKTPGAERVHAASHVGGDLPPSGGVGAQHAVRLGALARVTQAEPPPGDHRVARAPAGHHQPDARASAGYVHRVRVEALCERRDSVGRRGVAVACGRCHVPINTTESVPGTILAVPDDTGICGEIEQTCVFFVLISAESP